MSNLPDLHDDVYFGAIDKPLPDWRRESKEDGDDEDKPLTDEERRSLVAILGFDPRGGDQGRVAKESKDASGHEHGADGRFGSGGSSPSDSDLSAKVHEKLSNDIEHMEASPEGRKTLAQGAELGARVKSALKAGVESALKAADAESKGGISLISAGHPVAGTAQLFSSVFEYVHEEVFEAALAQHSFSGAHAAGVVAAKVAAKAETALLKAVAWSWRKVTAKESREALMEAAKQMTDADKKLLAELGKAAAQAIREVLAEAGIENAGVDSEKASKRIAQLLGAGGA